MAPRPFRIGRARTGLGLFATRPIKKRTRIAEYRGPILDKEAILTSLSKTNRLIIAEEGWPTCSIASEVMAICMEEGFDHLDAPVLRVTDEDVPLPYASNLEKAALIDSSRIVAAAKKVCYR